MNEFFCYMNLGYLIEWINVTKKHTVFVKRNLSIFQMMRCTVKSQVDESNSTNNLATVPKTVCVGNEVWIIASLIPRHSGGSIMLRECVSAAEVQRLVRRGKD